MLVLLWLSLGGWECRGDDTNSVPTFPDPSPAEQFVTNHLKEPGFIDLAANTNTASTVTNRTLSSRFLKWLLTANGKQLANDGLRLKNAIIDGVVDLSNVEVPAQVWFQNCHFQTDVILAATHFDHNLAFNGCLFDGMVRATALHVDGSLYLNTIDPQLSWQADRLAAPPTEAELSNFLQTNQTVSSWSPGHQSFILDPSSQMIKWIIKDGRVFKATNFWTNFFYATTAKDGSYLVQWNYGDMPAEATNGMWNLTVGPLANPWLTVTNSHSLDLNAVRAQVATALHTTSGEVLTNLLTANATNFIFSARWLFDDTNDPGLQPLVATWIHGSPKVPFFQPTIFRKKVSLDEAVIAGKLFAWSPASSGVEFRGGVYARSLKVGDDIVMTYTRFDGDADFTYAQIGHDFQIERSLFSGSFVSRGMTVAGSLLINEARFCQFADFDETSVGLTFQSKHVGFGSYVIFGGLKVDGLVDFQQAQFAGPADFILAHVKGNFQAKGAVFEDVRPASDIQNIIDDSFTFNTDFGSMQVEGFAIFENALFARSVSFRNAQFGNLFLDGVQWPDDAVLTTYTKSSPEDTLTNNLLRVEGMDFSNIRDITSESFQHTPAQLAESQKNLLAMLGRRSPYSFDIYDKLENYFQRAGAPDLADEIFIQAKVREGREATGRLAKFMNQFLYWTVGYGRQPWKAFLWSLGCIGFWAGLCRFCMVTKAVKKIPSTHNPNWGQALFFSVGTFLPIIDLKVDEVLDFQKDKEWFRYLIGFEKILGYILVPLWTMALTGLIK